MMYVMPYHWDDAESQMTKLLFMWKVSIRKAMALILMLIIWNNHSHTFLINGKKHKDKIKYFPVLLRNSWFFFPSTIKSKSLIAFETCAVHSNEINFEIGFLVHICWLWCRLFWDIRAGYNSTRFWI